MLKWIIIEDYYLNLKHNHFFSFEINGFD